MDATSYSDRVIAASPAVDPLMERSLAQDGNPYRYPHDTNYAAINVPKRKR